jgi:hypothetical protein
MKRLHLDETLSNNDHAFSAWLRSKGWEGDVIKETEGRNALSAYILPNGKILCKVKYDNAKCTYKVYKENEE